MKTYVLIEITHKQPQPDLADRAAGRVYNLQGVDNAEPVRIDQSQLEALVTAKNNAATPGDIADAYAGFGA
jgi:hypothetical protein